VSRDQNGSPQRPMPPPNKRAFGQPFPTSDPKLAKSNPYQGSSFLFLLVTASTERGCLPASKPQEGKSPVKPCIARKHLLTMYCNEIATLTNAATSQSSLKLSWRKMQKCESCTYINHSCLKQLLVAIVGIDSCSFSSLPVGSKLPTAAKASTRSKQEDLKKC
jgi:hypothetical protein